MPRISDFMILHQVEQPVLSIRTTTNINGLGKVIGGSFGKIATYLKELDVLMVDIPFVGFPNFESMNESNVDVMIGIPIPRVVQEKEDMKVVTLPEGEIAFCMYKGSYDKMTSLYDEMKTWIGDSGYQIAGAAYEYYYNGQGFPEEDYLTKVVMPLR